MSLPTFIQIHTITPYPAALLNRDDSGLAKRVWVGNAERTRISSQCLKKHWRTHRGPEGILDLQMNTPQGESQAVPSAIRSRRTFEEYVRLVLERENLDSESVRAVTEEVMSVVLGKSAKKKEESKKKKASDEVDVPRERLETPQVTVIGRPEIEYLAQEVREIVATIASFDSVEDAVRERFKNKALATNLRAMRLGAGLDAAMFGRMVTGDILARYDAAICVAHAMTVHGEQVQLDYFSAVDDLFTAGETPQLGSGHINTTELTSGLYYGYVVVNVPVLVSNIEGCAQKDWEKADLSLALAVVDRLIKTIAMVSPGAKHGSTAPFSRAELVLIELGKEQPRTLFNAFLDAVDPMPSLLTNTYNALSDFVRQTDEMYGVRNPERRFAAIRPTESLHKIAEREEKGLNGLVHWTTERF